MTEPNQLIRIDDNTLLRLDDEKRALRLQELADADNITSVLPEIAVLRLLEEEFLNEGNRSGVIAVAKVIGQLCRNAEAIKIRRGEMLAKPIILALAQRFAQLLSSKVAGKFDGWEDVLDEVRREAQVLIVDARNTPEHL